MTTIEYLRQFRIGGFAMFDFTASFLGMFPIGLLLSKLFRRMGIEIPWQTWLYWTVPISIIAHILISKMTPLTKEFLDPSGFYIVKIIVVALCILGAMGIKRMGK